MTPVHYRAMGCALLAALLLDALFCGEGRAQDSSRVNTGRLVLVGSVVGGTVVAVHVYQQRAWWQGPQAPFRFQNDWTYALNIDKFGHAYGSYLLSHLFSSTLGWVGFSDATSDFWGPIFGLGYQLYVEIEDGHHLDYGFSPGDAFSDIIGAAIPAAQSRFPVLQNMALKWSYYPSTKYINELNQGQTRVFIDDYQGQIYWISLDPHFLLSGKLAGAIPSWLGVSFGAAVRNLDGAGNGERMFYLALDYNLRRIETTSSFLHALFGAVDFIHLPAPGIGLEGKRIKLKMVY